MKVFVVGVQPGFSDCQDIWGSGEGVKEGCNVINVFGEGSGINMHNI